MLNESENLEETVAACRQTLAAGGQSLEELFKLGVTLCEERRFEEGIAAYRSALELEPDRVEIIANLGLALEAQGKLDEAIAVLRKAVALRPDNPDPHMRLAHAFKEKGALDEASASYRRALELKPDHAGAILNLANLSYEAGNVDEAMDGYLRALAIEPDFVQAHSNLGNTLRAQGRIVEAIASCRRALALKPDFADAHFNLSLSLLTLRHDQEGWQEYEWRWRGGSRDLKPRDFKWPRWRGEKLGAKRLLLHAEQGLGDTLQFARFVPLVAARHGEVLLAVQPRLARFLGEQKWPGVTVSDGALLSGVHVELPLMSLPSVLGTTEDTIPAEVPYLAADPVRVAAWRERLPKSGLRVGIVWRGRPNVTIDRGRSFPLRSLAPLARLPGVRLISLQKYHGTEEITALPEGMSVETLGPDFDNGPDSFLDTAAVMQSLDLIVTVDSAPAHLAGALGRPVWIALQRVPDWRWLLEREDSPWYPTARLFRQRVEGQWESVFTRMAAELARVLEGDRAALCPPRRRDRAGDERLAVPVSVGELVDKISILRIKSERITDAAQLRHVRHELELLLETWRTHGPRGDAFDALSRELQEINTALWDVEDALRVCERERDFGPRFIELARSVYQHNDRRAAVKRRINELAGSQIVEEKSYAPYHRPGERA